MNQSKAAVPPKGLDVFGAVDELHSLNAKEMNKRLRDSHRLLVICIRTGRGSFSRVNLQHLVLSLPLHLLACLALRGVEPRLRYLLRGVRLLHSLSDLALRHPKLEQIFLQDIKIREQILDLILYMLIALASPNQEGWLGNSSMILHAALVACTLHLLPAFVAAEWSDVVPVLLAHPKADIFMDVTFDAVRRNIGLLHSKLKMLNSKLISKKVSAGVAESMAQAMAQHCEASVQVLQSLCQSDSFRDQVLEHKELCRNGGLLHLALAALRLQLPILLTESKYLVSLIYRLKSKVLTLIVRFCEAESVSFLDEVAASQRTMCLAELVAAEVISLVKKIMLEEPTNMQELEENESIPSGLLYLHAMHLVDIFSDDSNFHNLVMDHISQDLVKVIALSPTAFLSGWCGSSMIEDAAGSLSDPVLIYDPFQAAGAAMQSFKSPPPGSTARASGSSALLPDESSGCCLSAGQIHIGAYFQERSCLFVKILANLYCFDPEVCAAGERDRFLRLFIQCLKVGPLHPGNSAFFMSTAQTTVRVCENLLLLLDHVSTLSIEAVSDDDLQLVSTFYYALHNAICPSAVSEDAVQEDPVVAFIKDAHEEKRRTFLSHWKGSERWQRIQWLLNHNGKIIAESSTDKFTPKTCASLQDVENDTCKQLSEEAQSLCYDRSLAKRKMNHMEPEDDLVQPQKKEYIQIPSKALADLEGARGSNCGYVYEQGSIIHKCAS